MAIRELEYPFDSDMVLKKAKKLKKILLEEQTPFIEKRIAVLGGSTTHELIRILELFLLQNGIRPKFYESEYAQYWQDAMFPNEELEAFAPELIYIHTTNRNIKKYPTPGDSNESTEELLKEVDSHFSAMWDRLFEVYHCPIIQNNMEFPDFRLFGNQDGVFTQGRVHFIQEINRLFASYASKHHHFFINDIQYQSAVFGLEKWSDPFYWHMYKYAVALPAIPTLAHNIANIIKSIFGKNKKALVLDLDHTLWGGVVGDDGVEGLEIGQETSMGQVYSEFQGYIKEHKNLGIMLNISSKNEEENAIAGLNHPDGILKPSDFIVIKANWEPKCDNIKIIAQELNILPESLVFIDDNPAEREIVRQFLPQVAVPEVTKPEEYIRILDRTGYFEVTTLSEDDRKRNSMYQANLQRKSEENSFSDYKEYLRSLTMNATIKKFDSIYLSRITQLTNKSNQFNLTTKRYTQSEIEQLSLDQEYLTLYGKLEDRFGDNGVVSIIVGKQENAILHIQLWLMSCRVLKRDMEFAMMDTLVHRCADRGIHEVKGYYYPTSKNSMVKDFYARMGFTKENEDENGNTIWYYKVDQTYQNQNHVIKVDEE